MCAPGWAAARHTRTHASPHLDVQHDGLPAEARAQRFAAPVEIGLVDFQRAGIGDDRIRRATVGGGVEAVAQLGHAFGRAHPPACDATGDEDFPYADDAIGQLGYDGTSVIPSDTRDIMSICPLNDPWVSDYTWEAMLATALDRGGG